MRLPRDASGKSLIKALKPFGYEASRQVGSHIRLTTVQLGTHHVTIPNHDPIRVGTLASILDDVASHFKIDRATLLSRIKI